MTEPIRIDGRGRISFFGRLIGSISKGVATVDDSCFIHEVNSFLMPRCKRICWQKGVAEKLHREDEIENAHLIKKARVYQLKPDVDPVMRFIGYAELCAKHGGVKAGNCRIVFDGDVASDDPEIVYRQLRDSPPSGYAGHPLTRSDILELYNPIGRRFFYVDTFTLQPIEWEEEGP